MLLNVIVLFLTGCLIYISRFYSQWWSYSQL